MCGRWQADEPRVAPPLPSRMHPWCSMSLHDWEHTTPCSSSSPTSYLCTLIQTTNWPGAMDDRAWGGFIVESPTWELSAPASGCESSSSVERDQMRLCVCGGGGGSLNWGKGALGCCRSGGWWHTPRRWRHDAAVIEIGAVCGGMEVR